MPAIQLRTITPNDWQAWRDLRLRALSDSPEAYHSKYDNWITASEERWRIRLGSPGMVNAIAEIEGVDVGMASAFLVQEEGVDDNIVQASQINDQRVLVGEQGAQIHDQKAGSKSPDTAAAEIISLFVVPEARGRGVGRALLTHFEEWAAQAGARRMLLGAMKGNEPALALYERAGYARLPDRKEADITEFVKALKR